MPFRSRLLAVLITLLFASVSPVFADSTTIFGDNFDTFENMLKSSDLIIVGSLVDSHLKRVPYGPKEKIIRCTRIAVEDVVNAKVKNVPSSLVIETCEGDSYDGRIEGLAFEPPAFVPGRKFIALLKGDENGFRLIYDSCGKIDIENDVVVYCNEPLESYLGKVKDFVAGRTASFEGQMYDVYSAYKPHSEENIRVGKTTRTEEQLPNNLFWLGSTDYFRPLYIRGSVNMQFRINPTGAKDGEGNAIPFDTLKTLVTNALNTWSSVDDTNITFSVDPNLYA